MCPDIPDMVPSVMWIWEQSSLAQPQRSKDTCSIRAFLPRMSQNSGKSCLPLKQLLQDPSVCFASQDGHELAYHVSEMIPQVVYAALIGTHLYTSGTGI